MKLTLHGEIDLSAGGGGGGGGGGSDEINYVWIMFVFAIANEYMSQCQKVRTPHVTFLLFVFRKLKPHFQKKKKCVVFFI